MWHLTLHNGYGLPECTKTICSAFTAPVSLLEKGIIETHMLLDPIFCYLPGLYISLKEANVPATEFDGWAEKIVEEFNVSISEYHNDIWVYDDILRNKSGISVVDDEIKQRNLMEDRSWFDYGQNGLRALCRMALKHYHAAGTICKNAGENSMPVV